jgi:hypothetical protein
VVEECSIIMVDTNYDEVAAALAPIAGLVETVRSAVSGARAQMGSKTWDGRAADDWSRGWDSRRQQIEALLQDAEEQRRLLLQKAANAHGAK